MKMVLKFCFALSIIISTVYSLYSANSPVVKLTSSNFQKEVVQSDDIWMIEFFAPWCGHCKNLAPEWEKAAKALKGILKIGAVDADSEKSLAGQYGVQGFPTIKFFGPNKSTPADYQGGRTADAIIQFYVEKAKEIVTKRLTGKDTTSSSSDSSKSKSSSSSSSKQSGEKKETGPTSDKDVVVLTDETFDSIVFQSQDMWLVEFYAPWCGHCKQLEPEWNKAASELKGKIKLGKVDATTQNKLSARYKIQGFPTIKIFPPGPKSDSKMEAYEGPREASGIVSTALQKLEGFGFVPEIDQLTNEELLKQTCKDKTGICLIAFLPHIIESSAVQRRGYLEQMKEASKGFRGKPIYFLWAQGGDFFDFEDKLHLSFGYPAVVAVNYPKKKYSICRSSFGAENLKDFVSSLLIGREHLINLPEITKLKSVTEWNGLDMPKEDTTVDDSSDNVSRSEPDKNDEL